MTAGPGKQAPDFVRMARPGIRGLRAYDPGHDLVALRRRFSGSGPDRLIELGSNENAFGPSPRAREAVLDQLNEMRRYPDPTGSELKRALANHHGLDEARLLLGNGSHELLMMLAQVFAGPDDEVVVSEFGFAVYALATQAAGAILRVAPSLPADSGQYRGHDLDAIAGVVGARTRMVYLANPNNPTGTWFARADLERFLEGLPGEVLVVVDEAYLEYATDDALASALGLLDRFPNLVVTRTFSKAYGLAGLRVGYLAADPGLIEVMERVRESFNANLLGLAACRASLVDQDYLAWVRERNAEERDTLRQQLLDRQLPVPASQTNFLLADFGRDAGPIEAALVKRGVVLRPMAGYGLPTCLRITVGTRDENRVLLQVLDEVLR